ESLESVDQPGPHATGADEAQDDLLIGRDAGRLRLRALGRRSAPFPLRRHRGRFLGSGRECGCRQKLAASPVRHDDISRTRKWILRARRASECMAGPRRNALAGASGSYGPFLLAKVVSVPFARSLRPRSPRARTYRAARGMPKSPSMFRQTEWMWLAPFWV